MSDDTTLKLDLVTEVDEQSLDRATKTVADRVKKASPTVRVKAEPSGPAQRLQQAEQRLRDTAGGDPAKAFDAKVEFERRRQQYQKALDQLFPTGPAAPEKTQAVKVMTPPTASGPFQRLREAQRLFANAQDTKDPARIQDALLNLANREAAAAKGAARLSGQTAGGATAEPFSIGRLRNLFGEGGTLVKGFAKIPPLLEGVAAGFQVFSSALQFTTGAIRNFSGIQFATGGTPKETAELDVLATMMGAQGKDMAALARQFQQSTSITGGNFGAQRFFGANIPPELGGNPDITGPFFKAIRQIIHAPNMQEAERMARTVPGMEQFLSLRFLPPQQLRMLDALSAQHAAAMQGGMTGAMALQFGKTNLEISAKDAAMGVIDKITGMDVVKKREGQVGFGLSASDLQKDMQARGKSAAAADNQKRAMDPVVQGMKDLHGAIVANTQATLQTLPLMRDANRHVFGGADRARALSPAHARYTNLQYFLGDQRLLLGQL